MKAPASGPKAMATMAAEEPSEGLRKPAAHKPNRTAKSNTSSVAKRPAELPKDALLDLYQTMLLVRRAEQRLSALFADGEIPGFIHLSIGQEAVAAGVCQALAAQDSIASTHRGHGHSLAKGVDLEAFFLEIMGKREGICGGRGGSMHVADMAVGMLGANGIVGAGLSLALGSALAHQLRRERQVVAAFFGDGAMAEGLLHECLNLAALWKLPLLFVCENNGWSEFSPTSRQFAGSLEGLAKTFGIPYRRVDGNDVEAVALAATAAVEVARGGGPQALECMTGRVRGHFEGDPQRYRDAEELAQLPKIDPIPRAAARLRALKVSAATLQELSEKVDRRIEAAVARGRQGTLPDFQEALADVYTRPSTSPRAGV